VPDILTTYGLAIDPGPARAGAGETIAALEAMGQQVDRLALRGEDFRRRSVRDLALVGGAWRQLQSGLIVPAGFSQQTAAATQETTRLAHGMAAGAGRGKALASALLNVGASSIGVTGPLGAVSRQAIFLTSAMAGLGTRVVAGSVALAALAVVYSLATKRSREHREATKGVLDALQQEAQEARRLADVYRDLAASRDRFLDQAAAGGGFAPPGGGMGSLEAILGGAPATAPGAGVADAWRRLGTTVQQAMGMAADASQTVANDVADDVARVWDTMEQLVAKMADAVIQQRERLEREVRLLQARGRDAAAQVPLAVPELEGRVTGMRAERAAEFGEARAQFVAAQREAMREQLTAAEKSPELVAALTAEIDRATAAWERLWDLQVVQEARAAMEQSLALGRELTAQDEKRVAAALHAAQAREQAVRATIGSLLQERDAIGKTREELIVEQLARDGATQAQLRQAAAILETARARRAELAIHEDFLRQNTAFIEQLREDEEARAQAYTIVWEQALRNTQDAFAQFFLDVTSSAEDVWANFLLRLVSLWRDAMAQMLAKELIGAFAGFLGGLGGGPSIPDWVTAPLAPADSGGGLGLRFLEPKPVQSTTPMLSTAGGAAGPSVSINVHAYDGDSAVRAIRANRGELVRLVQETVAQMPVARRA
jgi:hypothetical protein